MITTIHLLTLCGRLNICKVSLRQKLCQPLVSTAERGVCWSLPVCLNQEAKVQQFFVEVGSQFEYIARRLDKALSKEPSFAFFLLSLTLTMRGPVTHLGVINRMSGDINL